MAIKKIEIRPKGTGDYADVLYPRTSVDMVEGAMAASQRGVANGVASLDGSGKVPSTQLNVTSSPRAASLVVAASNSSAAGKAAADYVCDGVSDNVEINAAITALGVTGGKVLLLEGTFAITASINLTSSVSLEGQGNGTVLLIPNGNNATLDVIKNADTVNGNTEITISDLKIDGNELNQTGVITNNGISFTKVTNSIVKSVTVVNTKNEGIILANCSYNTFTGNAIRAAATGILFGTSCSYNVVDNNILTQNNSGISFNTSGSYNTISENICNNNSLYGINVTTSGSNMITGNICTGNGNEGIRLTNSSHSNTIKGNICAENSQSSNNFKDNIMVDASSNNNNIQGNTCRQGVLTNKPRYGIRINNANCSGNLVTNNDLYTGGATGAFSDVGTGTITTAGNKLA